MFSMANGIVVLCLLAIIQREKINQFYVPYDPEKLSAILNSTVFFYNIWKIQNARFSKMGHSITKWAEFYAALTTCVPTSSFFTRVWTRSGIFTHLYDDQTTQITLLVLIDFCPVLSEFLTWSFSTKKGSKTQNVEELSIDLMFHDNFW